MNAEKPGGSVSLTIRFRPGDRETLLWICEQMQMSKAEVIKRALAAYAAQITQMRR